MDLPPALHRRAVEMARARGTSLSKILAELTARGLGELDQPVTVNTDPVSGLPVVSLGRRVTCDDVADALDEQ